MTSIYEELNESMTSKGSLWSKISPLGGVLKNIAWVWLFGCIFTQCTSLSLLVDKVSQLESRPSVAQFGEDKTVLLGETVSDDENLTAFVDEVLPLLYSLTPFAPKDSDPTCAEDPKCRQAFKPEGIEIAGVGNIPQIPAIASYALAPNYQRPFLRSLAQLKPEAFEQGASLLYRISSIGEPEAMGEGEYRVYVTGSLLGFDQNQRQLLGLPDDKIVSLRPARRPNSHDEVTTLHQLVMSSRARGWEITQIETVEITQEK